MSNLFLELPMEQFGLTEFNNKSMLKMIDIAYDFAKPKLEKFKDLNVTRLAQGIPMGGEVHYLDENTLNTAFQSRKKIT